MKPLVITIDYDNNNVELQGDVCPDTEIYVMGLLKHIRSLKDTMKLSREIGNVPIQHNEATQIVVEVPDDPES